MAQNTEGFSWSQVIEHGTVLESCAIDALMIVIKKDVDMYTYWTDDKDSWVDFLLFQKHRSKAINKEEHSRYA